MENLQGGSQPVTPAFAFTCGLGMATAVLGFAVLGPVALLGLALCFNGDESDR